MFARVPSADPLVAPSSLALVMAVVASPALTAFGADDPPYLIEDRERGDPQGSLRRPRGRGAALRDPPRRPRPTVHARNLFHTSAGMWGRVGRGRLRGRAGQRSAQRAAEKLTAFTGDEYFPGGVYEWTVAPAT
jgi:hypothetical protein